MTLYVAHALAVADAHLAHYRRQAVPYTIAKRFSFSAAHHLDGLPDDHPCSRPHGHNYTVEIVMTDTLNDVGFVYDYRKLDRVKEWIDTSFDHRDLNVVLGDINPTAENLARFIFDAVSFSAPVSVTAVRVSETDKTWAEYRR